MKKIGCYLGLHRWQYFEAEGGGRYKKCRDCGKFKDIIQPPFVSGGSPV